MSTYGVVWPTFAVFAVAPPRPFAQHPIKVFLKIPRGRDRGERGLILAAERTPPAIGTKD